MILLILTLFGHRQLNIALLDQVICTDLPVPITSEMYSMSLGRGSIVDFFGDRKIWGYFLL